MRNFGLPRLALVWLTLLPQVLGAAIWTAADLQSRDATDDTAWFRVDDASLRARLAIAPHEALLDRSVTIELPMPDGETQAFSIVDSPIIQGGSRDFRTFKLHGIDDGAVSGRADLTVKGFRVMLQSPRGVVFIEPDPQSSVLYKSFYRKGSRNQAYSCGVHGRNQDPLAHVGTAAIYSNRLPMNYQTYRIAVSATHEYVDAVGGTRSAARAEITTAINRVNQVYESTLGIRLLLVANDGDLLEDDDDNCFSNGDPLSMLQENQVWIDATIGNSAYDIGHVFGTANGGVAFLGSACQSATKAGGVSGQPNPVGDPFYVDFVAHEIGHQLNADHTFNGTTLACGGSNRNGATAVEPGSGSTIMAYSGICDTENLQANSDDTFHATSIAQIDAFTAAGGSCFGTVANGNSDPTITAPLSNHNIPALTPFRLEVAAGDIDPDTLVYQWDQRDVGQSTSSATFGDDLGSNALFRSYSPQSVAWRDFPALGTQVLGQTDKAEVLPENPRALNFRVTVFDNNSGQVTDDSTLSVQASTGFSVTAPNGGTLDTTMTPYTITWDTANTESGTTVNCSNVDIELLTFNNAAYEQYSVHPVALGVPNDGSEDVATALSNSHPRARVRIKCSDNVFYDISDGDIDVTGTSATLFSDTDNTTFFNRDDSDMDNPTLSRFASNASNLAPQATAVVAGLFAGASPATAAQIEECQAGGGGGGSGSGDSTAFDPWWLVLLSGLAALSWRRKR